ncbi:ASCH domain-containing protein, partial [Microcoleus sp. N9_B4]
MVIKNGQSAARKCQPKSASSSSKSARSNSVSKGRVSRNNSKAADKLDGNLVCFEGGAVEGEAGDRILEAPGIGEAARGNDLSAESVELTAVTLHQPWASLVANDHKQYETRDWPTSYRGLIAIHAGRKPKGKQELREHKKVVESFKDLLNEDCPYSAVIAIAQLTDCVLMTEEFINQQTETELRCGNWQVGRYAWKLENVRAIEPIPATGKQGLWKWEHRRDWQKEFFGIDDSIKYLDESDSWNPTEFGELHHVAEADGQLNLLEWLDPEPPEQGDYEFREQFEEAFKEWAARQQSTVNSQQSTVNSEEVCNQLMDGSICAAESVQDSPMPESNSGNEAQTISVNGTATAAEFSQEDFPESTESTTSENATSTSTAPYSSSLLARLANPSQLTESDSQSTTAETVSPTCSELSKQHDQTSQLLKTSEDCS